MKENLFMLLILILVCVHFVISDPFKPVVHQKEIKVIEIQPKTQVVKPEIIPTTTITNVITKEQQTYSLFKIESGLFRINHETGEVHYFTQGLFIPVRDITPEQLIRMANPTIQSGSSPY